MKLLVSACLLGCPCRYDGCSKPCDAVIALRDRHILIPFCPEIYGGLPTPRTPAEIQSGRVVTKDGRDVTKAYEKGAAAALAVYDGTFTGRLVPGDGVTAACFRSRGIPICTEECLFPSLADTTEERRICCRENARETRG